MGGAEFLAWNRNPSKPTIPINLAWARSNPYWLKNPGFKINREQWIVALVNEHGWTLGAELGVANGRTFLFVLETCPQLTLIGVDLWEEQLVNDGPETWENWPHDKNEKNVREVAKKFGDRAIIIKDWTIEAAKQVEDESLDFIFIDADHSSEAVRNDIITWTTKVKSSGWILGHDINWPTVKGVVDDLLPGYVIGPDNAWGRSK